MIARLSMALDINPVSKLQGPDCWFGIRILVENEIIFVFSVCLIFVVIPGLYFRNVLACEI